MNCAVAIHSPKSKLSVPVDEISETDLKNYRQRTADRTAIDSLGSRTGQRQDFQPAFYRNLYHARDILLLLRIQRAD